VVGPNNVALSIIIPTIGRPSLARTLESILAEGIVPLFDEVIVISDGHQLVSEEIAYDFARRMTLRYITGPKTVPGMPTNRNYAMPVATGTHLMFIDDDDVYVDKALVAVREEVERDWNKIYLFREESKTKRHPWGIVWKEKRVALGNVGTQMIVAPNKRELLGVWGDWKTGDYDFVRSTVDLHPERENGIVWVDRVIANLLD